MIDWLYVSSIPSRVLWRVQDDAFDLAGTSSLLTTYLQRIQIPESHLQRSNLYEYNRHRPPGSEMCDRLG